MFGTASAVKMTSRERSALRVCSHVQQYVRLRSILETRSIVLTNSSLIRLAIFTYVLQYVLALKNSRVLSFPRRHS